MSAPATPSSNAPAAGAIDQPALVADLSTRWLAGLAGGERAEGEQLVGELVASWAAEADTDADPPAVNAIQREELEAAGAGQPPADRLRTLRGVVLARHVARLRVRTFALGRAIVDGQVDRAAARAQGEPLLAEAEQLAARVRAAGDLADRPSLDQALEDAMLEALYAVEGKAMSARLDRYAAGRKRPAP